MDEYNQSGWKCFQILAGFLNVEIAGKGEEDFRKTESTEVNILQFARTLKMKGRICRLSGRQLENLTIPVIASKKDGHYFIIVRKQEDQVMVLEPGELQPKLLTMEALQEVWTGTAILLTKKVRVRMER